MPRLVDLCAALAIAAATAAPAAASDKFWHGFANVGEIGIPLAAGGISLFENDRAGLIELAETGALTVAATEALKYSVKEQRPNGGEHSFPSAHTSIAFAGAGYLDVRYGWRVGLPFEALAAVVGFARVHTRDHHWYDAVAGAAIGEGSAHLFTRHLNRTTRLTAYGDSSGGGLQFATRF
ncbi:phosphatase PAP2 family protein (plasmid) [Polymorphobacter sp. PAMC 29334]|uniref:phosphatase PAP2 family protein n=1 Tax=Polymorphobacter sp. PAMC 29334 TaxID=2862331 RepID=UPI001C67BED1|nr:phosphatase PAP2 family protein [Polymorphobacter sp. PAMC 29334]QYE33084.1 phosphatase PAP2 family protein [Polymorphobacter sp. PAMC 29334]